MAVVVVSFDCRFLNRAIHPLDLAVGLGVVRLGQSVLDPISLGDHLEPHQPGCCCVLVVGLLRELDAVVREDSMDAIGDDLE